MRKTKREATTVQNKLLDLKLNYVYKKVQKHLRHLSTNNINRNKTPSGSAK